MMELKSKILLVTNEYVNECVTVILTHKVIKKNSANYRIQLTKLKQKRRKYKLIIIQYEDVKMKYEVSI